MAIKIIRESSETFRTECEICEAVFEYEKEDLCADFIQCPCCKSFNDHRERIKNANEIEKFRLYLERTPPVCVMPDLIHCSECKHGQQVGDLGVVCEYGCEEYRPFDHFCGWGERRDFASDTEDE